MNFLPPQWIDRIPSTNTALLQQLQGGESLPSGTVLAAHEQTAGRGRGSNRWQSAAGRDLMCSFVLHTTVEIKNLCSLSMAVALGISDFLATLAVQAQTKWPNDVVVKGRKICGILPELGRSAAADDRTAVLVVGVGLNVGMSAAEAAGVDQPATSVSMEVSGTFHAADLLPGLLAALQPRMDNWTSAGFGGLQQDWEARCIGLGEMVTIIDGDELRRGVLVSFGEAGQLRLDENGTVSDIWTGNLRMGSMKKA